MLFLRKKWEAFGANFGKIGDKETVLNFGNSEMEVDALRKASVLCDFSFVKKFSFDENDGIDFLDSILAANVLKLRYGKIIDTFLPDAEGNILAETFLANIDDKIFVIAESLPDADLSALTQGEAKAEDLTNTHVLLAIDGPDAWKIAKDIFGSDIFNLSYLSVEKYSFEGEDTYLLRNGKSGEFGYQFLAPLKIAESLADKILECLKERGGKLCGTNAHAIARLEGNFFNIYEEGARVKCPLELGLQWMIDFHKETLPEKLLQKRAAGISKKITALTSEAELSAGMEIFDASKRVGEIVCSKYSPSIKKFMALALIDEPFAMSGFEFSSSPNGKCDISSVSRPPFVAQSLIRGME